MKVKIIKTGEETEVIKVQKAGSLYLSIDYKLYLEEEFIEIK